MYLKEDGQNKEDDFCLGLFKVNYFSIVITLRYGFLLVQKASTLGKINVALGSEQSVNASYGYRPRHLGTVIASYSYNFGHHSSYRYFCSAR
jgi:hypothetical protein